MSLSPEIGFTSFSNYFSAKKKLKEYAEFKIHVQRDIRNNIRMHKHFEFSQ